MLERQLGQVQVLFQPNGNQSTNNIVSIPERQPLFDQVISKVSCGRKTFQCRKTHLFALWFYRRNHVRECCQAVQHSIDRVEQGLLILLVVLVISERLAFHQSEQGYERAKYSSRLSSDKFRHIGVLLLGHDR